MPKLSLCSYIGLVEGRVRNSRVIVCQNPQTGSKGGRVGKAANNLSELEAMASADINMEARENARGHHLHCTVLPVQVMDLEQDRVKPLIT